MTEPIIGTRILAVEGKDDAIFLKSLIQHLGIKNLNVYDYGGVSKLKLFFKRSGFENVKVLGLFRDADANVSSAFQSLKSRLRNENITPPVNLCEFTKNDIKAGVFIFPDNQSNGTLEDLCLSTVRNEEGYTCVEEFKGCISKLGNKPKHESKALVQAFLATKPEIAQQLGLGALKGYWNFDSEKLIELKNFLINVPYE